MGIFYYKNVKCDLFMSLCSTTEAPTERMDFLFHLTGQKAILFFKFFNNKTPRIFKQNLYVPHNLSPQIITLMSAPHFFSAYANVHNHIYMFLF